MTTDIQHLASVATAIKTIQSIILINPGKCVFYVAISNVPNKSSFHGDISIKLFPPLIHPPVSTAPAVAMEMNVGVMRTSFRFRS